MLYATFLNATTLELNPDTVRAFFRQSAARPQPVQVRYTNEPARLLCVHQFNFLKDILMADRTKYAFLPTTVCEVVLHATTVDIIYDRGIVSTAVADRRPFEDSNMVFTQFIASAINDQAGNKQGIQIILIRLLNGLH